MRELLTETRNITQGFIHVVVIIAAIAVVSTYIVWLSSSALQAVGSALAVR